MPLEIPFPMALPAPEMRPPIASTAFDPMSLAWLCRSESCAATGAAAKASATSRMLLASLLAAASAAAAVRPSGWVGASVREQPSWRFSRKRTTLSGHGSLARGPPCMPDRSFSKVGGKMRLRPKSAKFPKSLTVFHGSIPGRSRTLALLLWTALRRTAPRSVVARARSFRSSQQLVRLVRLAVTRPKSSPSAEGAEPRRHGLVPSTR